MLKNLAKHSIIYGSGTLLSKLLGFILLPIYTRFLTPADYGILSLLVITGSIFAIIAKGGLGSALFREVIYQESDESTVMSTAFYFLLGESLLFFGVLIIFSLNISNLIFGTAEYAHLLKIIFLTRLLEVFKVIVLAKLRIREQSKLYATLSVLNFSIGALLNIYFIVNLRKGVEGLLIAGLITAGIFAVVSLMLIRRDLKPSFSISILNRMLHFGVPLIPAGLSSLLMTSADRYFLQHFSTTTEVGLYSIGYKIGLIMNLMVQSVQLAWPAHMFAIAKEPDAEQKFSKMLTYYLVVFGFIGLVLSVWAREVLTIMTTPEFYAAYTVVPLIVLSYIFYGVRFITNTGLATQNKMKYMPPIIIGSALLNLYLNYLLIPRYGMMGAAGATVLSYLVLVIVQTAVNLHFWHIPYEYKRIAKIVLVWGIIYSSNLLIQSKLLWLNIALKLVLVGLYPLLLYLLNFYENRELATLKRIFYSTINRMLPMRKL